MNLSRFYPLIPGDSLPGDWFQGVIPHNIIVGSNCYIDSSFCFKHFYAKSTVGLRLGSNVTIWRTALCIEETGVIEVGDDCYLSNASLVCADSITLGNRILVAGGVTIVDSDFHPLRPAARLADTIALSPVGNRQQRPPIESRPVIIEDDVWIGYNAVILKGVQIGAGAIIEPGSVVTHNVTRGTRVAGNPALPVDG
ncbi:MAG: acyltransferase [Leptolyngbyaceae cyanobacterium]